MHCRRERTRKQVRSKLKLTLRGTYRPNGLEIYMTAIRRTGYSLAMSIERHTGKPCDPEQLLRDVGAPARPIQTRKVLVVGNPGPTDYQRKAVEYLTRHGGEGVQVITSNPRGPGKTTHWAEMRTIGDSFPIGYVPTQEG
jgi:hypothetical protein